MGVFWFNKIACTETLPALKTDVFKPNEKVFKTVGNNDFVRHAKTL